MRPRLLAGLLVLSVCAAPWAQSWTRHAEDIARFDPDPEDAPKSILATAYDRAFEPGEPAEAPVEHAYIEQGEGVSTHRILLRGPKPSIYGTGLVGGDLERTGSTVTLWNTDAYGWDAKRTPLYQSHPWVMAVLPDGRSIGFIFDSPARMTISVERRTPDADGEGAGETPEPFTVIEARTDEDAVMLWALEADTPAGLVARLSDLTGKPFMPPLWAIGFHQSQATWFPGQKLLETAERLRERSIPADAIWWDILFMDEFRMFTFSRRDQEGFGSPERLTELLRNRNFRSVAINGPYVKVDPDFELYRQVIERNLAVLNADGETPFRGNVWPKPSVFPDFTMAEARELWAEGVAEFVTSSGIDAIWNDMGEPSVFRDTGTMPVDLIHRADEDLGGRGTHARYHNRFGGQLSRATYAGLLKGRPNTRPFVLSRSGFLGGQQWTALWSGDNHSNWHHLEQSVQNVLNLGLSAQPMSGPDIGGFIGMGSPELFTRWMGVGTMFPFARVHSGVRDQNKDPTGFGEQAERASRLALQRRYRMLGYLYTAFEEAHRTGVPVMRPIYFADPTNPALRNIVNVFMLGEALVVAASLTPSGTPSTPPLDEAILPFGFPIEDSPGALYDTCHPDLPELYLRPGHILPVGPIIQHSGEHDPASELTLIINRDENGTAVGTLYEDDGESFDYQQGAFRMTRFAYAPSDDGSAAVLSEEVIAGDWPRPDRRIHLRVLTPEGEITRTFEPGESERLVSADAAPDAVQPACADGQPEQADPAERKAPPTIPELFADGAIIAQQQHDPPEGEIAGRLNAMYANLTDEALELGLTGYLAGDGTALAIFLDTVEGGQRIIDTSAFPPPPGGLSTLTGTAMPEGFAADRLLFANIWEGTLHADWLALNHEPPTKAYLGSVLVGEPAMSLTGGDNPFGVQLSIDQQAQPGQDPDADAGRGVRVVFPFAALAPAGLERSVRGFAVIVRTDGGLSNQFLPPLAEPAEPGVAPDLNALGYVPAGQAPEPTADGAGTP